MLRKELLDICFFESSLRIQFRNVDQNLLPHSSYPIGLISQMQIVEMLSRSSPSSQNQKIQMKLNVVAFTR